MKRNKFFAYLLVVFGIALMAEGCAASGNKGCGCGSNINKAYRTPKRIH